MKSKTIRRWSFIHTWTSLICTVFLLMLALTGLPLIFHHEIDHLLGDSPELREMPADTRTWTCNSWSRPPRLIARVRSCSTSAGTRTNPMA